MVISTRRLIYTFIMLFISFFIVKAIYTGIESILISSTVYDGTSLSTVCGIAVREATDDQISTKDWFNGSSIYDVVNFKNKIQSHFLKELSNSLAGSFRLTVFCVLVAILLTIFENHKRHESYGNFFAIAIPLLISFFLFQFYIFEHLRRGDLYFTSTLCMIYSLLFFRHERFWLHVLIFFLICKTYIFISAGFNDWYSYVFIASYSNFGLFSLSLVDVSPAIVMVYFYLFSKEHNNFGLLKYPQDE